MFIFEWKNEEKYRKGGQGDEIVVLMIFGEGKRSILFVWK